MSGSTLGCGAEISFFSIPCQKKLYFSCSFCRWRRKRRTRKATRATRLMKPIADPIAVAAMAPFESCLPLLVGAAVAVGMAEVTLGRCVAVVLGVAIVVGTDVGVGSGSCVNAKLPDGRAWPIHRFCSKAQPLWVLFNAMHVWYTSAHSCIQAARCSEQCVWFAFGAARQVFSSIVQFKRPSVDPGAGRAVPDVIGGCVGVMVAESSVPVGAGSPAQYECSTMHCASGCVVKHVRWAMSHSSMQATRPSEQVVAFALGAARQAFSCIGQLDAVGMEVGTGDLDIDDTVDGLASVVVAGATVPAAPVYPISPEHRAWL